MTVNFRTFSSLLLIILLFVSLNSAFTAVAEDINLNNDYFSIKPDELDQNTLIVLENLAEESELSLHQLDEERFLLIYGGRFYLLNVDSRLVKTENGEFELPVKTILINGKLLVPIYLIDILPEINIVDKE